MGVEEAEMIDGCIHWDIGSAAQKVLVAQSCPTFCDPGAAAPQAPLSMEFSRQEYWSGWPLLQGTFPIQGWNPGLLHCRQILDCLSHQESPSCT